MAHLVHIGLTVTDMARSRRFYEEAFGFRYDRELRLPAQHLDALMQLDPPSDIHAMYLMLDDFTLELMQYDPAVAETAGGRVFNQTGLAHLSIAVDDVAATLAKGETLGGTVQAQVGRAAVLRDPDGQLIELVAMAFYDEVEAARRERAAEGE